MVMWSSNNNTCCYPKCHSVQAAEYQARQDSQCRPGVQIATKALVKPGFVSKALLYLPTERGIEHAPRQLRSARSADTLLI